MYVFMIFWSTICLPRTTKYAHSSVYICKHDIDYLCKHNYIPMDLTSWYSSNFESRLKGRYITLEHLRPLLDTYQDKFEISVIGFSEQGKEIPLIKIGKGSKVVLAWSQMHGNESTTTKAVFDFLKFISQKSSFQSDIERFSDTFTVFVIPILNPDGAALYTRENANSIDLNRDAQNLSQSESVVLNTIFRRVKPDLCLNLHDQRTIYGLKNGLPATISFLAPAGDSLCTITKSREIAMQAIVKMNELLQGHIPGQIGRYDDSFNINCVGDTFQSAGVPTILFEAGHYQGDYQREKAREFIFYALLALFEIGNNNNRDLTYKDYFQIPENVVNFKDIILRNVTYNNQEGTSLALQYKEVLHNDVIKFHAIFDSIGDCDEFHGHQELEGNSDIILINSQEKVELGDEILTIASKNKESTIYFPFK